MQRLSALGTVAATLCGLLFGAPRQLTAQSSPTIVPAERGSEWMWGRSVQDVLGQLRVRSMLGGYPPQQRCAAVALTREGDVLSYQIADEAVEVQDGMSAAQACAPLLRSGEPLYPQTDVFLQGDYLTPMDLYLSPEFFFDDGAEVDGFILADEISAWGQVGAKPEDEAIPSGRIPDPNAVWHALVIFFVPADGITDDYQARPIVIDMVPDRTGR